MEEDTEIERYNDEHREILKENSTDIVGTKVEIIKFSEFLIRWWLFIGSQWNYPCTTTTIMI
jgi:hypothetical protein